MMPDYLTVTCRLPAAAEGHLTEALERWPVLGCEVADAGVAVDVTIYLEELQAASLPAVIEDLRALGASDLGSGRFADADWLAEYRRHVAPCPIGRRLWVDPHPSSPTPAPDGRLALLVEPRQAFGTGSHESTRLILLLLEDWPLAGARVLDVGTGSGILALAALGLGAAEAVGFDIDLEAVFVARQTVACQPALRPVGLFAGTASGLRRAPRFDLVLANLIPAQAEPMLAALRDVLAPGGRLLLSGLLSDQRVAVEADLGPLGFAVESARELGEWTALVCRAR